MGTYEKVPRGKVPNSVVRTSSGVLELGTSSRHQVGAEIVVGYRLGLTIKLFISLFLPVVTNVRRIINAFVPIIKYNQEFLKHDVDVSMSNLTGLYMSELLYIYGNIDKRVQRLTFCVRKWASSTGLTSNSAPGRWISNFSLTLLVLFFLQSLKNPIIPSVNHLIATAGKDDIRIADDNINCTFLRDLKSLNFQTMNNDSLRQLLLQFFEFYAQFDFKDKSVSLIEGKTIPKIDHSAMWIVNPLEPGLNVSRNVSFEEVERIRTEARNAAWILESSQESSSKDTWGLLNLFKMSLKPRPRVKPELLLKPKIFNISEIFVEPEREAKSDFKNDSSRREVNLIRETTKKKILKQKLRITKLNTK